MRYVFLETSTIVEANFAIHSSKFRVLAALANRELITVLTTDVTMREVKSNLADRVAEAIAQLKKAASAGQVFSLVDDGDSLGQWAVPDEATALPRMLQKLDKYFQGHGFQALGAMSRPGDKVFERYFAKRPPFGARKKKAEFPDAFAIDALEAFATSSNITIDVVATDPDWRDACADSVRLKYHSSLAALVEELQNLPNADVARATAMFDHQKRHIQWAIADAIVNHGVRLKDSMGEVTGLDVKSVALDDPHLIAVDDDDVAVYEVRGVAELVLDVHVPNESSYMYDSETRSGAYWDYQDVTIERELALTAEFSLPLTQEVPVQTEWLNLELNSGRPLEVYLDVHEE